MSSRSQRMRPKSIQKFQDKLRELTVRSQNLDAQLIVELNRVIQGTAHHFAPRWSTSRWGLRKLDEWLRRRLRCMKYKRFSYHDNRRMRRKQFERLGLLSLESFSRYENGSAKPCQRTCHGLPPGGFTLFQRGALDEAKRPAQGSPGAGKRHAGKYGEWTPSRQQGGGGGNATPLPTRKESLISTFRKSPG